MSSYYFRQMSILVCICIAHVQYINFCTGLLWVEADHCLQVIDVKVANGHVRALCVRSYKYYIDCCHCFANFLLAL